MAVTTTTGEKDSGLDKTTKIPGNTWYIPRVRYRMNEYEEHPSQKLELLLERIIKASTNANELVLDSFGGTFTTCAVAQRLGRKSIGMEIQPDYVRVGLRRLGIARQFNGEELRPLDKTYVRKNSNGVHGGAIAGKTVRITRTTSLTRLSTLLMRMSQRKWQLLGGFLTRVARSLNLARTIPRRLSISLCSKC